MKNKQLKLFEEPAPPPATTFHRAEPVQSGVSCVCGARWKVEVDQSIYQSDYHEHECEFCHAIVDAGRSAGIAKFFLVSPPTDRTGSGIPVF